MMAGERGERDRMPHEHAVQTVVRRDHVEQPGHRGLLEARAAGRVHAIGPASRDKPGWDGCSWDRCSRDGRGHETSIMLFEQVFYIVRLPVL